MCGRRTRSPSKPLAAQPPVNLAPFAETLCGDYSLSLSCGRGGTGRQAGRSQWGIACLHDKKKSDLPKYSVVKNTGTRCRACAKAITSEGASKGGKLACCFNPPVHSQHSQHRQMGGRGDSCNTERGGTRPLQIAAVAAPLNSSLPAQNTRITPDLRSDSMI